uniref:Uncharacterized protein n=1 Tax=Stegastes partitus TaxID=144197 RepID=A0A3B5AA54_9TELE
RTTNNKHENSRTRSGRSTTKFKPFNKYNLNRHELIALKSLKDNKNIVIKEAYKGGQVCIQEPETQKILSGPDSPRPRLFYLLLKVHKAPRPLVRIQIQAINYQLCSGFFHPHKTTVGCCAESILSFSS